MSDELKFFIFLIEQYANYKNEPTGDILRAWEEKNITRTIYENYPHYHTERIENAFEDIDSLMNTGKPAWWIIYTNHLPVGKDNHNYFLRIYSKK